MNPDAAASNSVRADRSSPGPIMFEEGARIFAIDRSFVRWSYFGVWMVAGFAALCLALPFLVEDAGDPTGIRIVAVAGALFFGVVGWLGFRVARSLPYSSIAMDDEGLWPAHRSKDGALVRWERIHAARERPLLQRLDLLDALGNTLLKAEYQLSGFESLRAAIVERCAGARRTALEPVAARSVFYHLSHAAGFTAVAALGWLVGRSDPVLGYGGAALLAAGILYEYLTTVSKLVVARAHLEVRYPLRVRRIRREDIADIQLGDAFDEGRRLPHVALLLAGARRPIRLRGLGVAAPDLHRMLTRWRAER